MNSAVAAYVERNPRSTIKVGEGALGAPAIGIEQSIHLADEPRVNCPEHGVVTAAVPWARHKSRFTKEFEELATWLAMNCSKTVVASLLRVSWNSIGPIISRMKKELDSDPSIRFTGLVNIGVDETSYKKGVNTILCKL